jgi:site-specific DNA-adenine methylase
MFHDLKNNQSSQTPSRAAAYHHGSSGIARPAAVAVRKVGEANTPKNGVIQGMWEPVGFNLRWNPDSGGDKNMLPEGYTVSAVDENFAYPTYLFQDLDPTPQYNPMPQFNPDLMFHQGPGNPGNLNSGVSVHAFQHSNFVHPSSSNIPAPSYSPQIPYGNMPQYSIYSGMPPETPLTIPSQGAQSLVSNTNFSSKRKDFPGKKDQEMSSDENKKGGRQIKKTKKLTLDDYINEIKEQWGGTKGLEEILKEYHTNSSKTKEGSTTETKFNNKLLIFLNEYASQEGTKHYDLLLQLFLHGNFNGYKAGDLEDRLSYFKYLASTQGIALVTNTSSDKISSSGAFDWDGSKESLMPLLLNILNKNKEKIVSVIEPFGGTGQLLQHMDIPYYAIADLNPYLIKFYETLASDYHLFEVLARQLQKELRGSADKEATRKQKWSEQQKEARNVLAEGPGILVKQALAFLYLQNQTKGNAWNIDPGTTKAPKQGELKSNRSDQWIDRVWPGEDMQKYYESILKFPEVKISTGGFQDTLKTVFDPNTMIYLDSPYPKFSYKESKGQTGQYTSEKFDQSTQYASIAKAGEFLKMGMTVVLSNYANRDLIQKCIDNGANVIYIAPVHHIKKRFPEMIAVFRPPEGTIPSPRSDAPIMQWFDEFGKVYARTAASITSARKELKILSIKTKQLLVDKMDWPGLGEKQQDVQFLLSSLQADDYELVEDLRFRLSKANETAPDKVHAVAEELIKNYSATWDANYNEFLEIIGQKKAEIYDDEYKNEEYKEALSGVDALGNLLPKKSSDEDEEESWDNEFMITMDSYFHGGIESDGTTGSALGVLLKQFHSNQYAYIKNRLMPLAGYDWLNYDVAYFLASFFKSKFKFCYFVQDQINNYFETGNGMTYSIGYYQNEYVVMVPDNSIPGAHNYKRSLGGSLFPTCFNAVYGKPMERWMLTFLTKMCNGEITERDIVDPEWASSFLKCLFQ